MEIRMNKKFSKTLFDQNDHVAKVAGFRHAALYTDAEQIFQPGNKYETDLAYKLPDGRVQLLECEVKRTWKGGRFPFPSIQVLYRKEKYFAMGAQLLLLAANMLDYLVIEADDIMQSGLVVVPNKYVPEGEYFFDVPVEAAQFYKLEYPARTDAPLFCHLEDDLHTSSVKTIDAVGPFWACPECASE